MSDIASLADRLYDRTHDLLTEMDDSGDMRRVKLTSRTDIKPFLDEICSHFNDKSNGVTFNVEAGEKEGDQFVVYWIIHTHDVHIAHCLHNDFTSVPKDILIDGEEDDANYGTCECCKEEYPHEGCGTVMMGCCEGGHCEYENLCGNCSFYYEPKGVLCCHACGEKNGWDPDAEYESDEESDSE